MHQFLQKQGVFARLAGLLWQITISWDKFINW